MIAAFPLMLIPFMLYNIALTGIAGGLDRVVLALDMLSGATWTLSLGDVFILISLALLFFEIIKATWHGSASLVNHMLSMLVFIAFLVEFLLVPGAATQIFFVLMTIAFIDVAGGFAISVKSAGRDVSIGL
jgi:hypothetical protein